MDFAEDRLITSKDPLLDDWLSPKFTAEECKDILYANSALRFFFEVSLPASNKRKETMGNIFFICSDKEITKHFLTLFYYMKKDISITLDSLSSNTKPGDLAALFTNRAEGDILIFKKTSTDLMRETINVLGQAMSNNILHIPIGKGPSARNMTIDIPLFTVMVCSEQKSTQLVDLYKQFDYVIEIKNEDLVDLCKAKLKSECSMITDDACEFIIYNADYDMRTSENYLKRIVEYLEYKNITGTITEEFAHEVFKMARLPIKQKKHKLNNDVLGTEDELMADIKFEILKKVGVLSESKKGWTKELNIISWNNADPKYDLRDWNPTHDKMGKGITLTRAEAEELYELLGQEIDW